MGPDGGAGYVYIGSESGCTFDTVTEQASCQACTLLDTNSIPWRRASMLAAMRPDS